MEEKFLTRAEAQAAKELLPKINWTATKAVAGAAVATAIAFLGALGTAVADDVITTQEWTVIGVTTLSALGITFGVTYNVSNRPKL